MSTGKTGILLILSMSLFINSLGPPWAFRGEVATRWLDLPKRALIKFRRNLALLIFAALYRSTNQKAFIESVLLLINTIHPIQMGKWLLINSEGTHGPGWIWVRRLRALEHAARPSQRPLFQEECSSFTGQYVGSKEQRVNPSDYYMSACSVTTAATANPFISWTKSSSASWGVLHDWCADAF